MEPKPLRFHKTEGANNHVEQGDTFVFARHPIGITYNQLPAMFTNVIHIFFWGQGTCHMHMIMFKLRRHCVAMVFVYKQEMSLFIRPIDGGNCRRFLNFCERIFYNTPFVTFIAPEIAVRID